MAAPKLRAAHKKSYYKNESAYLDAVYRKNKEYIDSHTPEGIKEKGVSPKAFFKAEVRRVSEMQNQMTGKKYTLNRAIKRVANSKMLNPQMSTSDIKANNFQSLLKKDKDTYRQFRNRTRKGGRFTSFDYSKLKFDGYYNINGTNGAVYIYDDDTVIIEFKSPQNGTGASSQVMSLEEVESSVGKTIFYINNSKGGKL